MSSSINRDAGQSAHQGTPTAVGHEADNPSAFMVALTRLQNDLGSFIKYCEATKPSDWYLQKVRNKGNTKNCLYGHLVNWYYGKDYQGDVSPIWDAFEEVGSSYYIFPINDGTNPRYPQKTARERCIAYLNNVVSGDELWTAAAMDKEWNELKAMQEATT